MPPLKLRSTPSLYTNEEIYPLPVLVATTKAFPGKNPTHQAAAFTAVVARSLEEIARRSPGFPKDLNLCDCFQEAATKSTANNFLIAKFRVVNPAIINSIAQLIDSSPLLPIKEPNPGFVEIKLSWENRIGKYYRILDVPQGISATGLVVAINHELPCKYVDTYKGPGGFPVVGQHVVEFTVASARDIPPEITTPNQHRNKRAYSIRVLHVPNVDAASLTRVPIVDWIDTPSAPVWISGPPTSHNAALFARQSSPNSARPSAPSAGPSAGKSGKAGKNENSPAHIAQQNFVTARNKQKQFQAKVANNDKVAAAKKARLEQAALAAAAVIAKQISDAAAAAAKEKAESELYVRKYVLDCIAAAFERHAPEEAAAIKAAAAADTAATDAAAAAIEALRLQKNKRVRADSDKDDDEDDDENMHDADTSKNDSKKVKEAAVPAPMAIE